MNHLLTMIAMFHMVFSALSLNAKEMTVYFQCRQQAPINGHFLRTQGDNIIIASLQFGGTIERTIPKENIERIRPGKEYAASPVLLWEQFYTYSRWLIPWFDLNLCNEMLDQWSFHYQGIDRIDAIIALEMFSRKLTYPEIRERAGLIWLKECAIARQWESIVQWFEDEPLECPWRVPEILWVYRIQAHWNLSQINETMHWLMQWLAVHYPHSSPNGELTQIYNQIIENWDKYNLLQDLKPLQPLTYNE